MSRRVSYSLSQSVRLSLFCSFLSFFLSLFLEACTHYHNRGTDKTDGWIENLECRKKGFPGFSSSFSVPIPSRVVLGADDQTAPLLGAAVDGLDDIDQLLLVLQDPVQLVVVSRAEIAHHVLVSEETKRRQTSILSQQTINDYLCISVYSFHGQVTYVL